MRGARCVVRQAQNRLRFSERTEVVQGGEGDNRSKSGVSRLLPEWQLSDVSQMEEIRVWRNGIMSSTYEMDGDCRVSWVVAGRFQREKADCLDEFSELGKGGRGNEAREK